MLTRKATRRKTSTKTRTRTIIPFTELQSSMEQSHRPCFVPHIYLTDEPPTLFQVSFNTPDDILSPNVTKNSTYDCGYKTLAALGLRNKQRMLMESNLVNKRGRLGIDIYDMCEYIQYIYDLVNPLTPEVIYTNVTDIDSMINTKSKKDDAVIQTKFKSDLEPNYATIFFVQLENNTDSDDEFGHYVIAYNLDNIIYYYNPQTHLTSNPPELYLSTNLSALLKNIFPLYHLEEFWYFDIYDMGVPTPVIKRRLTSHLTFRGGKSRKLRNRNI